MRNVKVHDPRLYDSKAVLNINGEDAVHPLKLDHNAAFDRERSAAQAGTRSARQKRNSIFIGDTYDSSDVFGLRLGP